MIFLNVSRYIRRLTPIELYNIGNILLSALLGFCQQRLDHAIFKPSGLNTYSSIYPECVLCLVFIGRCPYFGKVRIRMRMRIPEEYTSYFAEKKPFTTPMSVSIYFNLYP